MFRHGKSLRPWTRHVDTQNVDRNDNIVRTITKNLGSSKAYLKDPIYTTRVISSSNEYIKEGNESNAYFDNTTDKISNRVDTLETSEFYSGPSEPVASPQFSAPNKIYYGFKPIVSR